MSDFITENNKLFDELYLVHHLYDFYREDIVFIVDSGQLMKIDINRKVQILKYFTKIGNTHDVAYNQIIYNSSGQYCNKPYPNSVEKIMLLYDFINDKHNKVIINQVATADNVPFHYAHYKNGIIDLYHITPTLEMLKVDSFQIDKVISDCFRNICIVDSKVVISNGDYLCVYHKVQGCWIAKEIIKNLYCYLLHVGGTEFFYSPENNKRSVWNPWTNEVYNGDDLTLIPGGFIIIGTEITKYQNGVVTKYPLRKGKMRYTLNPNYIVYDYLDRYEVLDLNLNLLFTVTN